MKTTMIRLMLALALLLTQTAVAVHDVHCLDEVHDETCAVYATQDHSGDSNVSDLILIDKSYQEDRLEITVPVSAASQSHQYLSRAPPRSH